MVKTFYLQETKMSSDGSIKVNNLLGTFELKGLNLKMIFGYLWRIHGSFFESDGKKQLKLEVKMITC